MACGRVPILRRVLTGMAALLVVKVTTEVVLGFRNYFPPDFDSEFLGGREAYFFGSYRWAFYPHIVSGPLSLFVGLLLVSRRFLVRYPKWHRILGRLQVANVLLVVAPSGFWMARYSATGAIAGVGFAILSVLTGGCAVLGWRMAVGRRFVAHRRWMQRCFLLLCSAVTLRVLGGTATVLNVQWEWFDPIASWSSWLVPLTAFEVWERRPRSRPEGTEGRLISDPGSAA